MRSFRGSKKQSRTTQFSSKISTHVQRTLLAWLKARWTELLLGPSQSSSASRSRSRPSFDLDPSWWTGLAWADQLGVQWGSQLIFTYGPLGFITHPVMLEAVHTARPALR